MKKNKVLIMVLCMLMIFSALSLTGCGKDTEPEPEGNVTDETQVVLYYANAEYVASGDDSLEELLSYETTISAEEPEKSYLAALEALKDVPGEEYDTLITKDISFNGVTLEGDIAYVDLKNTGLNGGSLSENFLISQIVDTLIESFDEIKQVQFLVEGEKVDSLMGHLDAGQPFTEDVFLD